MDNELFDCIIDAFDKFIKGEQLNDEETEIIEMYAEMKSEEVYSNMQFEYIRFIVGYMRAINDLLKDTGEKSKTVLVYPMLFLTHQLTELFLKFIIMKSENLPMDPFTFEISRTMVVKSTEEAKIANHNIEKLLDNKHISDLYASLNDTTLTLDDLKQFYADLKELAGYKDISNNSRFPYEKKEKIKGQVQTIDDEKCKKIFETCEKINDHIYKVLLSHLEKEPKLLEEHHKKLQKRIQENQDEQ